MKNNLEVLIQGDVVKSCNALFFSFSKCHVYGADIVLMKGCEGDGGRWSCSWVETVEMDDQIWLFVGFFVGSSLLLRHVCWEVVVCVVDMDECTVDVGHAFWRQC